MKKIVISIKRDGTATSKTSGYSGHECLEASQVIESALGDVQETQATEEMYQSASEVEKVRQR